jgi:hypothetical protein
VAVDDVDATGEPQERRGRPRVGERGLAVRLELVHPNTLERLERGPDARRARARDVDLVPALRERADEVARVRGDPAAERLEGDEETERTWPHPAKGILVLLRITSVPGASNGRGTWTSTSFSKFYGDGS